MDILITVSYIATPPENKRLILFPNLKHDLFHETEKEANDCIEECVGFIVKYCGL